MWLTPLSQHKRQVGKRKITKIRADLHIRRIPASLRVEGKPNDLSIYFLLNDLSTDAVEIFSNVRLSEGESVTLSVPGAESLELKAKVLWCSEYRSQSHITFSNPCHFRCGLALAADDAQKTAIENHLNKIRELGPSHAIFPPIRTRPTAEPKKPPSTEAVPAASETPSPEAASAMPQAA